MVVDFIIEQNKKCSERAKKIKISKDKKKTSKESLGSISKKSDNVRKILNSGTFGCNTDKVHSLMRAVLEENFPIDYVYENIYKEYDVDSIFENYDRNKKFVNYCLLECSDLNDNCDIDDGDFSLKIEDEFFYNLLPDDYNIIYTDYKYLEVATEDQVKTFIKNQDYDNIKSFFAFLNLD